MIDIVERLGEIGDWVADKEWHQHPIAAEAQREIASLRAQVERMKSALEPFALNPGAVSLSKALGHITREHLLAAKEAFSSEKRDG